MGRRDSRDLYSALTRHASSESRLPGRCPGLACRFPFGAEFGTAQHENAPAKGLPFPAWPRPTPYRPDAPVLILRLQLDVPKGQSQISPGQRPGTTSSSDARALTGRNRIRFFTGDRDVAIAETCGALTGHAALGIGWLPGRCPGLACRFLFGAGIRNRATRKRAGHGSAISRPAASSPTPTRRASFDLAPSVRRPEGAVTNQPRATPREHVQQPNPSPDGAKQNSVFHGRLGRRDSRDLWRPYRARFLGIAAPRALPWAGLSFPLRGGIRNRATRKRAGQGSAISRPAASNSTPTRRASFDVAPSVRRPEGAVTNQPRATPWEHVQQPIPSPDGAKQNSVFHGRLRRRDSRDLWRPYRARVLGIAAPRALPWAGLSFPLRGGIRNCATRKRAGQGSAISRPAASNSTPTRRASFDFAPSARRPEGAVTNQPRATPWDHFQQPRPSPDGAKQNSVFHGRLRRRDSRDL